MTTSEAVDWVVVESDEPHYPRGRYMAQTTLRFDILEMSHPAEVDPEQVQAALAEAMEHVANERGWDLQGWAGGWTSDPLAIRRSEALELGIHDAPSEAEWRAQRWAADDGRCSL
jgi:hypothetical protein